MSSELALLQEQLKGLAKAVESDTNLPANIEDYLVTLNSLNKRIKEAHKMPYLMGGTQTGRITSKNPLSHSDPRISTPTVVPDVVPKPDRRAAIQHTRKLNESSNNS